MFKFTSKNPKIKLRDFISFFYVVFFLTLFFLTWHNVQLYNLVYSKIAIIFLLFNSVIFVLYLPKLYFKEKNTEFLLTLLLISLILIHTILTNGGLGAISLLVNSVLMIVIFKYIKLPSFTVNFIVTAISLYFIYFINADKSMFNPNLVALLILITFIYIFCAISYSKKINIVLQIVTIYVALNMILVTESRGALLGLIFFLATYYLLPSRLLAKKIFFAIFYGFLTVGSLIFTLIYVELWKNNFNLVIPFSDKPLYTGREAIWYEVWEAFFNSPITGIGSSYILTSFPSLSIHNTMLNILAIYGIVPFVIFIFLLGKCLITIIPGINKSKQMKILVLGFCSLLIVGFFENNIMYFPTMFVTFFLILAAYSRFYENSDNFERG